MMSSEPRALFTVLLDKTGLTQADAAALFGITGRTVRRWIEGIRTLPTAAIDRLAEHDRALDQTADRMVRALGDVGSAPVVLLVYRRDRDVPLWTGVPTAGCHLALVRRIAERRPDVLLVTYDRGFYRRWLGSRPDFRSSQDRLGCLSREPC